MLCRIALFGKVFVRNKQLNGDNRQLVFLLILYLTSTQNEIFGELYPPYFAVSRFFLSGTRLSLDPARSGCWSNKRRFLLRLIFCQMNMYIAIVLSTVGKCFSGFHMTFPSITHFLPNSMCIFGE